MGGKGCREGSGETPWERGLAGAATEETSGGGDELANSAGNTEEGGLVEVQRVSKQELEGERMSAAEDDKQFAFQLQPLAAIPRTAQQEVGNRFESTTLTLARPRATDTCQKTLQRGRAQFQSVEQRGGRSRKSGIEQRVAWTDRRLSQLEVSVASGGGLRQESTVPQMCRNLGQVQVRQLCGLVEGQIEAGTHAGEAF